MEYRIVEKEAFQLVGIKQQIHFDAGTNNQMNQMFAKLTVADVEEWKAMSDGEPAGIVSMTIHLGDTNEEGSHLEHHIGVITNNYQGTKWDVLEIPASTWVVFTSRGEFPQSLNLVWQSIYADWLPESGYEVSDIPEMLWHEEADVSKPDYHSEIWLAVLRVDE